MPAQETAPPKFSIITVCRNSEATIGETIESVLAQRDVDIEYVVVDGASSDRTIDIVRSYGERIARVVSEPDGGLYDAMNKGLTLATGDIVAFLNSDDVYAAPDVLARVAAIMADPAVDACYANLFYVARDDTSRVVRRWASQPYEPGLFERGWMPAHPTFFVRRSVYQKHGGFDLSYGLQADFELALRLMRVHGIRTVFIPETWVRMRAGGVGGGSIRNVISGNLAAYRACRDHNLDVGVLFIARKIASRIPQFFAR